MPTNGRLSAPGVAFTFERCDFPFAEVLSIQRIAQLSSRCR